MYSRPQNCLPKRLGWGHIWFLGLEQNSENPEISGPWTRQKACCQIQCSHRTQAPPPSGWGPLDTGPASSLDWGPPEDKFPPPSDWHPPEYRHCLLPRLGPPEDREPLPQRICSAPGSPSRPHPQGRPRPQPQLFWVHCLPAPRGLLSRIALRRAEAASLSWKGARAVGWGRAAGGDRP